MTSAALLPLAVPAGPDVLTVLPAIDRALAGRAPVLPYATDGDRPVIEPDHLLGLPDDLAVVIATSGSTGVPKRAMLSATALRRSAEATHEVLGGPGAWLLAMPAHHVAGLQVLVRSLVAGSPLQVLDLRDGFHPTAFAGATDRVASTNDRRYTAVVPTQLARLLDDRSGAEALTTFDGVLVGGAATPRALVERAREAGVALRLTYGMSETSGGCVYDGTPLPGSHLRLDDDHRVVLGGDTVAHGYLGDPLRSAVAFAFDDAGRRWFRTDDLGHLDDRGLLVIEGRADDVINTGGLKITPGLVEDAMLRHLPEVQHVVVLGLPDAEWGEIVGAAVTLVDPAAPLDETSVRSRLRGILPDAALPRRVHTFTALPWRGPGKPDRAAIRHEMTRSR